MLLAVRYGGCNIGGSGLEGVKEMGEKGSMAWKVAALACAILVVGAAVAIVVLALDRGGDGGKEAL